LGYGLDQQETGITCKHENNIELVQTECQNQLVRCFSYCRATFGTNRDIWHCQNSCQRQYTQCVNAG